MERRNGCAHCAAVSEANLNFVPLLPLIGDPSYSTSTIRHSFIHRSAIATFTIHSSTVPNFAVHIHAVLKSIILSSRVPILVISGVGRFRRRGIAEHYVSPAAGCVSRNFKLFSYPHPLSDAGVVADWIFIESLFR